MTILVLHHSLTINGRASGEIGVTRHLLVPRYDHTGDQIGAAVCALLRWRR